MLAVSQMRLLSQTVSNFEQMYIYKMLIYYSLFDYLPLHSFNIAIECKGVKSVIPKILFTDLMYNVHFKQK